VRIFPITYNNTYNIRYWFYTNLVKISNVFLQSFYKSCNIKCSQGPELQRNMKFLRLLFWLFTLLLMFTRLLHPFVHSAGPAVRCAHFLRSCFALFSPAKRCMQDTLCFFIVRPAYYKIYMNRHIMFFMTVSSPPSLLAICHILVVIQVAMCGVLAGRFLIETNFHVKMPSVHTEIDR